MNAAPFLSEIGRALERVHLQAVLIGNAGAALVGAPVTTVDFDFLFRKTPRNLAKLKTFARGLGATVLRPYYPRRKCSAPFATTTGCRSTSWPRSMGCDRSKVSGCARSKRAAGRARDRAVLEILEKAHEEASQAQARARGRPPRK